MVHASVLRILGLVLVAAAALKGYGLALDPVPQAGWLSDPLVQFAMVEIELLLGVWFVAGWRWQSAWLAAVAVFAVFGGLSLDKGLAGQTTCGCFGNLPVHPWFALGLDVAALAALLIGRPKFERRFTQLLRETATTVAPSVAGAGAVLLVLSGLAFIFSGSPVLDLQGDLLNRTRWLGKRT